MQMSFLFESDRAETGELTTSYEVKCIMTIIQIGNDNYLVLSGDDPIFELKFHCSKEDLALFDNRELHQITQRIFDEYKKVKLSSTVSD